MKKIILTLAMVMSFTALFAQQSGGNDKNQTKKSNKTSKMTQQDLPQNSQATLNEHFPSNTVKSVKQTNNDNNSNYKVKFDDGLSVSFDNNGDWNKVTANSKTSVPNDMVPSKISNYVSQNYSNQKIKSVEKRSDGGYNITLASGIALVFSSVLSLVSASK